MQTILQARIVNPYRSRRPLGFYNLLKGHTGVDMEYKTEPLPSPVTGKVLAVTSQKEMGRCIYLEDYIGNVHVFSHMSLITVKPGDSVKRNLILGQTGNTGGKTTGAHLHYEIITRSPINEEDKRMTRKLYSWKGWNTDPIKYLKALYAQFSINPDGTDMSKSITYNF